MPVYVGRPHKYAAVKCSEHTPPHASLRECARYKDLWLMEKAGKIRNLRQQVRVPICGCGKRVYVMDFTYVDDDSKTIFEDCKGFETPINKLKRHLLADKGIVVRLT